MGLRLVAVVAIGVAAVVDGITINHDQVEPFVQPAPVTISEKAAVMFKPSLSLADGCNPYPAVNAAGETSGGLKPTGGSRSGCEGSDLGSQIYGRAAWAGDVWGIMYAWYFPKDKPLLGKGTRHNWEHLFVWLDNPALEQPTMRAISLWNEGFMDYVTYYYPLNRYKNGNSPNVFFGANVDGLQTFRFGLVKYNFNPKHAKLLDLILWEQLTDAARIALEETDFGAVVEVPFKNSTFQANLERACPNFRD